MTDSYHCFTDRLPLFYLAPLFRHTYFPSFHRIFRFFYNEGREREGERERGRERERERERGREREGERWKERGGERGRERERERERERLTD